MNGIIILDKPQGFTSFDGVAVLRGLAHEKRSATPAPWTPWPPGAAHPAGAGGQGPELPARHGQGVCGLFPPGRAPGHRGHHRAGGGGKPCLVSQQALEPPCPPSGGDLAGAAHVLRRVRKRQALYELARKGLEVERQARPVTVSRLELLSYDPQSREGRLRVACSKGTYIRVLIEDIAKAAGSCGTMTALRRVRACGFEEGTPAL